MTGLTWALLGAAVVAAVLDWVVVGAGRRDLEYAFKPLTLALLIVLAIALEPADDSQRWWFVAALALSLVGDVLLMLPADRFVLGVGAFLLAHLSYVGGFVRAGFSTAGLLWGAAVVASAVVLVGRPMIASLRSGPDARLAGPVVVYLVAISVMVVAAFGTGHGLAATGAVLFYASDALIGWRRFVSHAPWTPVTIMVTYHVGQALLVLSLLG